MWFLICNSMYSTPLAHVGTWLADLVGKLKRIYCNIFPTCLTFCLEGTQLSRYFTSCPDWKETTVFTVTTQLLVAQFIDIFYCCGKFFTNLLVIKFQLVQFCHSSKDSPLKSWIGAGPNYSWLCHLAIMLINYYIF